MTQAIIKAQARLEVADPLETNRSLMASLASLNVELRRDKNKKIVGCKSTDMQSVEKARDNYRLALTGASEDFVIGLLLDMEGRGLGYRNASDLKNEFRFNTYIKHLTKFPADALKACLLYTSPSPRDATLSRMPSSA